MFMKFKRLLDILISLFLLILFSPLFLILMGLNAVLLGFPLFFRQERIGLYGHPFWIYKFRSMRLAPRQLKGPLLQETDHQRLTPYGAFLRRYSLDELPSLVNVLKGEMSLIGPRPLLPEFLDCYSEAEKQRHNMRPGMTGLAQIKGRNDISWRVKFRYDVWYVRHYSWKLDFYILCHTLRVILSAEGTTPPVDGYLPQQDKHNGFH